MLEPVADWNPFDVLLERDSDRARRPDLVFASEQAAVPVVGLLLVHAQPQYGARVAHAAARAAIDRLVGSRPMAVVPIDTRLEGEGQTLRTPSEVESLIARMDLVITTRLHGLVLALKHAVPAIAIDPIAGGAKVRRQCEAVGWPVVFTADSLVDTDLNAAFEHCLTAEARDAARLCTRRARVELDALRSEFLRAVERGASVPGDMGTLAPARS